MPRSLIWNVRYSKSNFVDSSIAFNFTYLWKYIWDKKFFDNQKHSEKSLIWGEVHGQQTLQQKIIDDPRHGKIMEE